MSGQRIRSLDVRCVTCGADPGARCRSLVDASKQIPPHERRRDEARRQDRIANPEHVDGQLPLFPKAARS